jgi:membrane-associated progesterone receptor component
MQLACVSLLLLLAFTVLACKRKGYENALRQCVEEGEALRKHPRLFTPQELQQYDGRNPRHPLLLAIKGRVLDVRTGFEYYGAGGPYTVMAGRDASKAFAMMTLKEEDAHPDVSGVPQDNLKILDDWYDKLSKKYPTVGSIADNSFGYHSKEAPPGEGRTKAE